MWVQAITSLLKRMAILLEPYSHSFFDIYYTFLNKKTMNKSNLLIVFLIAIVSYSCSDPAITDDLLDGNVILIRHYNPEQFLVSAKYPNPTDLDKHIIAVHGYSATTFEWQEFADWSAPSSSGISQVLLDGHGRDYESFKASRQDWSSAIKENMKN
jgi:carboxylesterase